jgi:hypothetical protein
LPATGKPGMTRVLKGKPCRNFDKYCIFLKNSVYYMQAHNRPMGNFSKHVPSRKLRLRALHRAKTLAEMALFSLARFLPSALTQQEIRSRHSIPEKSLCHEVHEKEYTSSNKHREEQSQ